MEVNMVLDLIIQRNLQQLNWSIEYQGLWMVGKLR